MIQESDGTPPKQAWGSKLGFILATAGAAVGLGNIQRFPYVAAQNGGGWFVLLYLAAVVVVGIPMVLVEFSIGRASRRSPLAAFSFLSGHRSWGLVGLLGTLTAFSILTYYVVAAGWSLGFAVASFSGQVTTLSQFSADPSRVISYTFIVQLLAALVVGRGLNKGIERFSTWAMPVLLVLLILLAVRSCMLEGAWQGITYYLKPDPAALSIQSVLAALSQAFFSLCVGEAVLITYGSFAKKSENLVASALYIALFDTVVAIVAGLVVFPALFTFGQKPDHGVAMLFDTLPGVFSQMPFGQLVGGSFFLMLAFAGLTTCVALLEIPALCLHQLLGWPKKRLIWVLSVVSFLASIPAALSMGANPSLSELRLGSIPAVGYYALMDYLWGGIAMVITGLLTVLFCGWVWTPERALKELAHGCPGVKRLAWIWQPAIKWVVPLLIVTILAAFIWG